MEAVFLDGTHIPSFELASLLKYVDVTASMQPCQDILALAYNRTIYGNLGSLCCRRVGDTV